MNRDRKKLSDIGTLVKPRPESMTQYEPFVQMTMEERREFFTAAYKRGWNESREWHRRGVDDGPKDFDEVLKDEGL